MGLLQSFTPLMRVPSAILNKIQSAVFDQRGNGPINTLAPGLNAVSTAWDPVRLHASLDRPVIGGGLIDNSRDYRDRMITVRYRFDPARDIRPGEASDHVFPRDVGIVSRYSGNGVFINCTSSLSVWIGPTGNLFVVKSLGWAALDIEASCQLKERS